MVFKVPLVKSNAPDKGLATRPTIPWQTPLKNPSTPSLRAPLMGFSKTPSTPSTTP